ncbi:MAG: ammonium transporter [Anaerolineae bacterium]|nr:ammonium transporter [Anaerolineae bacterium]
MQSVTPTLSRLGRLESLRLLAVVGILLALLVPLAALADGPTPVEDPAGITTGSGANLIGVAPGTLNEADFQAAEKAEPFALKLADLVNQNRLGINFTWTLVAGFLVMFMQAGFALVETGFTRARNAAHTMTMNFVVYFLGMAGYFVCGFAFQFGGIGTVGVGNLGGLAVLDRMLTVHIGGIDWGLLGLKGFFLNGTYDVGVAVMFLFQMVFMDTVATIPTGSMAERWKWSAFCIYGLFVSMIIYPVYGMWVWGGGWLSQLGKLGLGQGYLDFAGSGVVHAVGGWTALAGAIVIGPRLGKYNKDGTSNTIPGHNMVIALLGVLILGFGWFGFNPGSTLGASGNGNLRLGMVAVVTMLASSSGGLVAMLYMWITTKKPDPGMTANGFLAGLVAITAPSGFVSPMNGFIIGAVAGILVCVAAAFIDQKLKVDDPVGAIAVHGCNGLWGQIALGLFADGTMNYGGLTARGLFYGDASQLVAQVIGAVVAFVWAFGISYVFFKVVDRVVGLRVSPETELGGLDMPEMGALAYPHDWEPAPESFPLPPRRVPAGAAASPAGD